MKKIVYSVLSLSFLMSSAFAIDQAKLQAKKQTGIHLQSAQWKVPNTIENSIIIEDKLPNSPYTQAVILGNKILNYTTSYIGPQAKNPKNRYAGNNLSCSSCHANAGTIKNQSGFVGIYARFPQYNARADKIITLEDRINGCMERSMNGKRLPNNSPQMKAILAYMHYISQGIEVGAKTQGQGLPKISFLKRAADPKKGKEIYQNKCVACHGENGEGIKSNNPSMSYYIYPALWGNDSYNTGAGMYRLIKAASYIKANMPKDDATLTLEQAYDVAAYINSQPRPIKKNRNKDFPDRDVKPADMDLKPYAKHDKFSIEQHRYGPFEPLYINTK
ncbi:c-type cytochrome [Campylobacter lari]|uniref:c-type cytochrome n=1 Tax=Campylobacter lari TaxID=201 RepID=UPI0021F7BA8A|nr:c-type cytochrome [Campylobacter lari]MCW0185282.1 c-type cytochrome [Campylobacter lari]